MNHYNPFLSHFLNTCVSFRVDVLLAQTNKLVIYCLYNIHLYTPLFKINTLTEGERTNWKNKFIQLCKKEQTYKKHVEGNY
jgi:hypothetical protein